MNIEARLVDVQEITALEYFDPVCPVWILFSSGNIRFGSRCLIQFSWGDFL